VTSDHFCDSVAHIVEIHLSPVDSFSLGVSHADSGGCDLLGDCNLSGLDACG
jgi:hypothetical protein